MTEDQLTEWPDADRPVVELSDEECWARLDEERVGRLGYQLVDEIHVIPINYAVVEGSLVFRTAAGGKLLAAELHSEVALEIDRFNETDAWSVLVRGRLRHLEEDEAERLADVGDWTWVPTLKYDLIEVVPTAVTGRYFFLRGDRPA